MMWPNRLANQLILLDNRGLQFFASRCVRVFFQERKIVSKHITCLVEHLESMPNYQLIEQWNRKGAILDLNGRGDPWPKDFIELITAEIKYDVEVLIDSAVEVGICDLYGADTKEPVRYAKDCASVLRKYKMPIPEP